MNRRVLGAVALLLALCLSACGSAAEQSPAVSEAPQTAESKPTQTQTAEPKPTQAQTVSEPIPSEEPAGTGEKMIYAQIGDHVLTIRPEDNSPAQALMELLADGDVTVSMHDYGGFEKVGALGTTLPTNDERITTEPGDVILYQGDQITIYYDTNTWSFTRLGRVQGLTQQELLEALGEGDPTVVFSLEKPVAAAEDQA